jgi:hypothetical protein
MSTSTLTRARSRLFPSSSLVAAGLVAGFAVAQGTGIRALGGAILVGAALGLAYLLAFVLSHVLTLGLGVPAWLSVALVTIGSGGVTFWAADRG